MLGARVAIFWRRIRTGVAFACFGVWAVLLALAVLGAERWRKGARADLDRRAQAAIHRSAIRYLRFARALGLLRITWPAAESLAGPGPRLIAVNHPTLLDVVLLFALLPQADCIVNAARAQNRLLRGLVRAAGYLPNSDGPHVVTACVERLRRGRTLVIFPEGTRSPRGGLGRFQRGAAQIALRSGLPITPVVIHFDPPALGKHQSWYDVPDGPFHVTIRVLGPILPARDLPHGVSMGVAARRLTAELREAIRKELAGAGVDFDDEVGEDGRR